jgi:hypothetical protein
MISLGNVADISAFVASSDSARARWELFFGCQREMKKHCIQFSNLKLDREGDRFGL